jgi:NifB/MoaA-like Fe-S oxidoreductase
MHKSTLEQQINEMSDLEELDRIACRYAQGGNKAYALLAWLRAEELGCTKYRKNITAQYFSPELCGEERKRVMAMVRQWVKEGNKDALETIKLLKSLIFIAENHTHLSQTLW